MIATEVLAANDRPMVRDGLLQSGAHLRAAAVDPWREGLPANKAGPDTVPIDRATPETRNSLPLSVAIITLNEEEDLPRCLESVRDLASEIVVVDCGSTDRTADVARRFGAKFETRAWENYAVQKNHAISRCTRPWVLCLDADEAVSPELAASIRQAFAKGEPAEDGFLMNRRNFYLGDWIRHAWHPEWRLRLVRKAKARWTGLVHEKLEVQGHVGKLSGNLLHYPFRDFEDNLRRQLKYARIVAAEKMSQGKRFRWYHLILYPWFEFFKRLIVKQGWRDGWRGWLIAIANMTYTFAKYAFMLETELLARTRKSKDATSANFSGQ